MDTTANEPTTGAERIKAAITQTVTDMFKNKKISETHLGNSPQDNNARKDAEAASEEALQAIITNLLIDFNRIARSLEALAKMHGALQVDD